MECMPVGFRGPSCSFSILRRAGFCISGGIRRIIQHRPPCAPWVHVKRGMGLTFRFTASLFITVFFLSTDCYAECCTGEIRPKSGATSQNTFVWDGKELRPRSGATSETTWLFDGKEIRKKSGATASCTYLWTGSHFKPKSGATARNTWVWAENELKPQSGATSSNTWKFDRCEWALKHGATSRNSLVVTGFVPIPICALVILGLN
jgi:hypothetical protein